MIIFISFGLGIFSNILYLKYKINIMETYGRSQQAYVNGQLVENKAIKADYDGNNLDIDLYENGNHFYSKLSNNDIASILSHRASSLPLEKRLMNDFSIKHKSIKHKSTKRKSNKRKSNKRKSNKRKSNKNKKK
jgi:hypothetical protein